MDDVPDAECFLMSADDISALDLSLLPAMIRQVSDARARVESEWRITYENYKLQVKSLTAHYHRELKLRITAARTEAEIDPEVADTALASLKCRNRLDEIRRVERNLRDELDVRLALMSQSAARSGD